MLNKDALQQLSQLKTTIVAQKDIAQGHIRTTTKRFGFLALDDGRDAFINPEQMMRVLPDDRVEAEISTNAKGQFEAKLLQLIKPGLNEFVGRYVNKGTTDFVEPDVNNFNRWLFIPPQERKGYKVGDLIHCSISRHPFNNDGKVQVHIHSRLGALDEPGIESRYSLAKFQLPNEWTPAAQNQASSINWSALAFDQGELDLTHLPFVTVDSENTRDMDDAVYIASTEHGWELITAIADPTKHIDIGSPLELAARERASTAYLLGQTVTMLPVDLSHDTYSLVPEQKRPALICRMQITPQGEITHYEFAEAQIRSQQKLSYQIVQEALSGIKSLTENKVSASDDLFKMLQELQAFAQARAEYRQTHALVMEDRPDYFYMLNDQKKIEYVDKRERNMAHRIIEEAMLVTNLCAGELFMQHPGYGLFSSHIGFRPERLSDAKALVQEDRPDLTVGDLSELNEFQALFKELRLNPSQHPANAELHSLLQRMLQAGSLSADPIAHFGLGFKAYAMVTSPIRRYHDFYNHLAIKRILRGQASIQLEQHTTTELAQQLQHQLNQGRQACRHAESWLGCQFLAQHIGSVHPGTVALVNSFGIGVKLEDWGFDGYALLAPKDGDIKAQFDARRLSLTIEGKSYKLDQKVFVLIKAVDIEKRKVELELVSAETAERLSAWL